jgi:hypothetical protein
VARCLRDPRNSTQVTCTRPFREKVVFGLVEAIGCFTRATRREDIPAGERRAFDEYRGNPALADALVSRQRVTINGITFSPIGGASIVVFPQIQRIVSSRAEIRLGDIRVRDAGSVNLALDDTIARVSIGKRSVRARLLEFDPSFDAAHATARRLRPHRHGRAVPRPEGSRHPGERDKGVASGPTGDAAARR